MTDLRETVARALDPAAFDDSIPFVELRENLRVTVLRQADAAIRAIEAAGYAVVKKEPTEAMLRAACEAHDFPSVYMGGPRLLWAPTARRIYRSMLEAAASPPLAKET